MQRRSHRECNKRAIAIAVAREQLSAAPLQQEEQRPCPLIGNLEAHLAGDAGDDAEKYLAVLD